MREGPHSTDDINESVDREPKAPHAPETFGIDIDEIEGPLRPMMEELGIWQPQCPASESPRT